APAAKSSSNSLTPSSPSTSTMRPLPAGAKFAALIYPAPEGLCHHGHDDGLHPVQHPAQAGNVPKRT
ncbi:hypothetical protein, partial [Hymenobacter sp. AT01-02]|uniref:hypothetical protein n=1 Tax=Hymenobacter sp. AT01-02 TaxID=1571877 RepID=UPI001F1695B9